MDGLCVQARFSKSEQDIIKIEAEIDRSFEDRGFENRPRNKWVVTVQSQTTISGL
jgi:hypothetical protein